MKSRNVDYIPEIDHLRLLAALLVFGFHFFHFYAGNWAPHPQLPWLGLVTEGYTGVALFFVLSGYIFMTIALQGGAISYRDFLRNRLLRIAPLFLVVFAVAISIGRDKFEATDILYLLFSNIGDPPTSWHFVTGPAWSISVEFTFYLVFPFLAVFARERGIRYLISLIALLLVVKFAAYLATERSTHMLYSTLVGRFDQFLVGMMAAMIAARRPALLERHGRGLLTASVVATLIAAGVQSRYGSYFDPNPKNAFWILWGTIEAALWASVILGYLSARLPLPAWAERPIRAGGVRSFSLYMWHTMIIFAVHQSIGRFGGSGALPLALNLVVVLALALGFAWLSYATIEKPFLDMRGRYRKPAAPETAAKTTVA